MSRLNRDALITQALLKVGAIDPENGFTPSAAQITNAASSLNSMVKSWTTMGLNLWERKYAIIFPQQNQGVYYFGIFPDGLGDHSTVVSNLLGVGEFLQTKLTVAAPLASPTVVVSTLTNPGSPGYSAFTAGGGGLYLAGILLDSGIRQWTIIAGTSGGNTITLTDNLTGPAAIGNSVIVYLSVTRPEKPLRILNAFYRQPASNDIPIRIISREEYSKFGFKPSQGTSIQLYYDPQVNSGLANIYPVPSDASGQIFIEYQQPIKEFSGSTSPFDLPAEWEEAIIWNLALRQIPDYRPPEATASRIERLANRFFEDAKYWDQEQASVYFQPDNWVYQAHSHGH